MKEIVITPEGPEAVQVGTLIDDDGQRFVVLTFQRPNEHVAIVTFTPSLFRQYAAHLSGIAAQLDDPELWEDG